MDQSALLEITRMLQSADDGTMIRTLRATFLQVLVDAEATATSAPTAGLPHGWVTSDLALP